MTIHSDVSLVRPRSRLRLAFGREANFGDLAFRRITALFAASVIVLLVWFWLSGLAILLGGEINAEAARRREAAR